MSLVRLDKAKSDNSIKGSDFPKALAILFIHFVCEVPLFIYIRKMKVTTPEEVAAYQRAVALGGVQGAAVGALGTVGLFFANKRYRLLRGGSVFARTFFAIAPPILAGVTSMEWASRRFEKEHYGDLPEHIEEQRVISLMSPWEKVRFYTKENKYKIVFGLWAAAMGGSYYYINKDKYMSLGNKLVQARVYAQGLTVVLLLATVALSVPASEEKEAKYKKEGAEWEKIVQEEEERERAAHLSLSLKDRKHTEAEKNGA